MTGRGDLLQPGEDQHGHRRDRGGEDAARSAVWATRAIGPVASRHVAFVWRCRGGGADMSRGLAGGGGALRRGRFWSVPEGPGRRWRWNARSSRQGRAHSANPYPRRDGDFATSNRGRRRRRRPLARLLPGALLVRALNSVYFKTLQTEAHRAGTASASARRRRSVALDIARVSSGTRVRAGRRRAARQRALLRSRDAGLQHRHERRDLARALGVARTP